jgi:hypothetical protein
MSGIVLVFIAIVVGFGLRLGWAMAGMLIEDVKEIRRLNAELRVLKRRARELEGR